ncbi:60S ribosomal protein L5, mitochondrial, partial [Cucurbita argyrosperma subsp. sororia]
MSNFSVRIATVMSLLDSPVEIRENSMQFSMATEFCSFSPKLEDHFEIFEHIIGFNVTIVTSANTQDETLPPWNGFLQKDEGETQKPFVKIPPNLTSDMRDKDREKLSKLTRKEFLCTSKKPMYFHGSPSWSK